MSSWESSQRLFEAPNELREWDADDLANLAQFEDIQAALSGLVLADERLRLTQSLGHVCLSQAPFRPDLSQKNLQLLLRGNGVGLRHHMPEYPVVMNYAKIG
jgi:hypothetical protein